MIAIVSLLTALLMAQSQPTPRPPNPQPPPTPALQIVPLSPSAATAGSPYSIRVSATGGTPPYRWESQQSTPGFTISSSGVISGTPGGELANSRAVVNVRVRDSVNGSATASVLIPVNAAPAILPQMLSAGAVGTAYSAAISVSGGTNPQLPVLAAGSLPPGMGFDGRNVSGTPTAAGTYAFTLRSTDANGATAQRSYALAIGGSLSLGGSPPVGAVGVAYDFPLSAAGGVAPYRFRISSGALPPGVSLSAVGRLTGRPSTPGTFTFGVTLTDARSVSTTASFTIVVRMLLRIDTASVLPRATRAVAYLAGLSARGGTPPYRWTASGLPPGLTLSSEGNLFGSPTSVGVFAFSARVNDAHGQTASQGFSLSVVSNSADEPSARLSPDFLLFTGTAQSAPQTQSAFVTTSSEVAASYTLRVAEEAAWLRVPASVSASSGQPAAISVTADPASLAVGSYTASVVVSGPGLANAVLRVTLTVGSPSGLISPTPLGLTFTAVQGGAAPPGQRVTILNPGTGLMDWRASVSTLSGGDWLQVFPPQGTSDGTANPSGLQAFVRPDLLPAGDYYGVVRLDSTTARNTPQLLTVALRVLPSGSSLQASPSGVQLVNASSQTVSLSLTGLTAAEFFLTTSTQDGAEWLEATPESGILQPGQPLTLTVRSRPAELTPGLRLGQVILQVAGGERKVLDVALSIIPGGAAVPAAASEVEPRNGVLCSPTQLVPLSTLFAGGFNVPAGWPTPVEVRVVDDCGTPLNAGDVTVSFSNGDAPLSLVPIGNGRWSGTWTGRNALTPEVTVTVLAVDRDRQFRGQFSMVGGVQLNPDAPVVASGGVVNAATYAPRAPLAPGSLISVFGSKLATTTAQAAAFPLAGTLGVTTVTVGGRALPLLYAADGQINAVMPFDLPQNTPLGVLVRRGATISVPEPVIVASNQPGLFTRDSSGSGQGLIVNLQGQLVDASAAAARGDTVLLFATGLGAVTPSVDPGTAAPSNPLAAASGRVTVTVGGQPAQVVWAGLAPGFTGLYQVNVKLPASLPPGTLPVVLDVNGRASNTVTVQVQ